MPYYLRVVIALPTFPLRRGRLKQYAYKVVTKPTPYTLDRNHQLRLVIIADEYKRRIRFFVFFFSRSSTYILTRLRTRIYNVRVFAYTLHRTIYVCKCTLKLLSITLSICKYTLNGTYGPCAVVRITRPCCCGIEKNSRIFHVSSTLSYLYLAASYSL